MPRNLILLAAAASLAACATVPTTEIRLSQPRIPADAGASELVRLGQAQLGLGNVALALESFRKAARLQPASIEALGGIAIAYERMGRFDLSSRYYESALAIAPQDAELLARLAASLEAAGQGERAAQVRSEIAIPGIRPRATIAEAESPKGPTELRLKAPGRSVPRLVRLSAGEIALVSGIGPVWEAPKAPLPTPPRSASREPLPGIAILNAARVARLAARTRARLEGEGWRGVAIGDAPEARATSVIFYPPGRRGEADVLARKFGIVRLLDPDATRITILLGRDLAAARPVNPRA